MLACTSLVKSIVAVGLQYAFWLALVELHPLWLCHIAHFARYFGLEMYRTAMTLVTDFAGPVWLIFAAALLANYVVRWLLILG